MTNIAPFLWFESQAAEAMNFYVGLFDDARVLSVQQAADGGPVFSVSFSIGSQTFHAINGGPHYVLTPATSWMVTCNSQREIDRLWDALSDGGKPDQCGWVTDRFGVTWQIVPEVLLAHLSNPDHQIAARVQEAMLGMTRIDIAEIERAAAGG